MAITYNPAFYNPSSPSNSNTVTSSALITCVPNAYCTYGFNLNFIGAAIFPQVESTFIALQSSLMNMDASNPAALLQVQLTMSEYENTVQTTSALYASWETLLKAIIQNV